MLTTNELYIEHFNEQSFDWLTWKNGSISYTLKIPQRTGIISINSYIIRKYAIGYCKADNIPCRPKQNQVAVMFCTDGINNWWTHLLLKEFNICFPELKI